MKIGILFPVSNVYPGTGSDFMDGLNSFWKQKPYAGTIKILKEAIGFGGDEKDNYQKAQKLLITDEVDILIAYLDEKIISIIYPLVMATNKLLIVINPGANYPVNWIAQPTVIRLSLQHAFLCSLTGTLAAAGENRRAALATTYYDCGYLHSAAMVNSFMDAGGKIKYNYINNQAYNEFFEINNLTNFLSADPACNNLLCVFDKLPASLFFKCLNNYQEKNRIHLFASPLMLQETMENVETPYAYSIEGYLPWYKAMENDANKIFREKCAGTVTMFSLLGWEAAMIINDALENFDEKEMGGEQLVHHLKTKIMDSPRGRISLDHETQFYTAPVSKFILKAGDTEPEIITGIDIKKEWRSFTSKPTEGPVTGWLNTYLCY